MAPVQSVGTSGKDSSEVWSLLSVSLAAQRNEPQSNKQERSRTVSSGEKYGMGQKIQ